MNLKHKIKILAAALLIATTPTINAAPPAPATQQITQKAFATPDDAAKALAEAVRAEDVNALLTVVGPSSRTWLFSGDAVTDRNDWKKFLADFDQKHSITESTDNHAFLLVGNDGWPFPRLWSTRVRAGSSMPKPVARKSSTGALAAMS